jgi:preprotein translocase subunit SecA
VAIHKRAAALKSLHEPQLTALLAEMRSLFRRGDEVGQQPLHEALACVCEAARRQVHLQPYEVQIMAALAAHRGHLLEMATGEGKTLAIALPAVLAGWTGRPCHIITANDYLATRDAEWLSPFYQMCGLTAGCVTGAMKQAERKANYARDIIYTTSKEGAADLLRDRLQLGSLSNPTRRLIRTMLQPGAGSPDSLVMRGLHTAIVDEADSALIDEAVTPLIISRKQENEPLRLACEGAHRIAQQMQPGLDYSADPKTQEIAIKPAGKVTILQSRW